MSHFTYQTIDLENIPATAHKGESGMAQWRTWEQDSLRIRRVDYSPGYLADHWCRKGHIVYCLEGSFVTEMENGEKYPLEQGMAYIVSDEMSSHRSYSENGVKLLIIDGGFLGSDRG